MALALAFWVVTFLNLIIILVETMFGVPFSRPFLLLIDLFTFMIGYSIITTYWDSIVKVWDWLTDKFHARIG
jgi:hypothetical protein